MINSFNVPYRIRLADPSSNVLRTRMNHTTCTAMAGTHPNLEGEPIKIQSSCPEDGVSPDNLEWRLADSRIWESGVTSSDITLRRLRDDKGNFHMGWCPTNVLHSIRNP